MKRISTDTVQRLLFAARPLLAIATLAAIAASWLHLVGWMARFETTAQWWAAALAATAVDIGLLAALRTVGEQSVKGRHDGARDAKFTVVVLVLISFAANVQHSLTLRPDDVLNAVAVSGVLPLVAVLMSHLYDVVSRSIKTTNAQPRVTATATIVTPATPAATGKHAAVLAAAMEYPDVSRRKLAAIAGTTDTLVRGMETRGELHRNGHGWEVAASNGHAAATTGRTP